MKKNLDLGAFPAVRMRRNRSHPWMRRMVAEHTLAPSDLIWPVFIREGKGEETPVPSMPGVMRLSIDVMVEKVKRARDLLIPAVALFPVVASERKSEEAKEALNPDNLLCRAVRAIKQQVEDIGVICDVALDPYTTHGHDGLMREGVIINDETVEVLCRQALVQAKAGCDIVAPSDMMDGRIGAIRRVLDESGFEQVKILSYAAKYASNFYGPFRDAVGSKASLAGGDKRTYQMDPANSDEALREVALDIQEGADMIMVKPGMPYLDVLYRVAQAFPVPVFAYQVSGEYAMIKAAAGAGWLDGDHAIQESLIAFKRAGAAGILSYAALEVAEYLNQQPYGT